MSKKYFTLLFFIIILFNIFSIRLKASSLNLIKGNVIKSGEIIDGVTYENFLATTYNDNGTSGNQNISFVKNEAGSGVKVVAWSKLSSSGIIGANIIDLAKDFESKNPGYQVIAGINGDYYDPSTKTPINALVQNSDVIKYNNFNLPRYFSIGISDQGTSFITSKNNEIESSYVLSVYDNTNRIIKEIKIVGFNIIPSINETSVVFKNMQEFIVEDASHFLIENPLSTNYGTYFIKGKVTKEVLKAPISSTQATIITKDNDLITLLKDNPTVKIQKNMKGSNNGFDNIIGVGSQPLKNNIIQSFEDINDQSISFSKTRNPRSSIGFNSNGEVIIATIDGRRTTMDGADLREVAYVMQSLGCTNAFNFDGGGSTQLMIKENGVFKMLNSPSETYRSNANGILFVVPDVSIDLTISSLTSSTVNINYSYKLASGVTLNNLKIYQNNQEINMSSNELNLSNLNDYGINYISFVADYQKNGLTYQRCFVTKRINIENYQVINQPSKVKPSNFNVTFEKHQDQNRFDAVVNFDDPSNTIVKVYLINGNDKQILIKDSRGYIGQYNNISKTNSYNFKIEYHYIFNSINPISEVYDKTFEYTYEVKIDEEKVKEPSSCALVNLISLFFIGIPLFSILLYRIYGVRK